MSLQGNLREFSSTEILQLLASQRKTGCLVIEQGNQHGRVYVLDGRIVSTRNDVPIDQDSLFRFLRRVHRLSEEQLRGIITLHAESDRDLVQRAATMRSFYRPSDQADAVELFDAFVDRLLELERRGYLTVTFEREFILTTGRFRGARTQLTARGSAFIERYDGQPPKRPLDENPARV